MLANTPTLLYDPMQTKSNGNFMNNYMHVLNLWLDFLELLLIPSVDGGNVTSFEGGVFLLDFNTLSSALFEGVSDITFSSCVRGILLGCRSHSRASCEKS